MKTYQVDQVCFGDEQELPPHWVVVTNKNRIIADCGYSRYSKADANRIAKLLNDDAN